jgi:hypothetical protein
VFGPGRWALDSLLVRAWPRSRPVLAVAEAPAG